MALLSPFRGDFPGVPRRDPFLGVYLLSGGGRPLGLFARVRPEEPTAGVISLPAAGEDAPCPPGLVSFLYADPRGVTRRRMENLCAICPCLGQAGEGGFSLFAVNDPVTLAAFADDFCDRTLGLFGGRAAYLAALSAAEAARRARYRPEGPPPVTALLLEERQAPVDLSPAFSLFPAPTSQTEKESPL